MSTKHTPGQWTADDNEGYGVLRIWSGMSPTGSGTTPGKLVATVHGDSGETDANGQLIAAAPELLNALQRLVKVLEGQITSVHAAERASPIAQARAAINKATGETP